MRPKRPHQHDSLGIQTSSRIQKASRPVTGKLNTNEKISYEGNTLLQACQRGDNEKGILSCNVYL
jgi:hypothetical protein